MSLHESEGVMDQSLFIRIQGVIDSLIVINKEVFQLGYEFKADIFTHRITQKIQSNIGTLSKIVENLKPVKETKWGRDSKWTKIDVKSWCLSNQALVFIARMSFYQDLHYDSSKRFSCRLLLQSTTNCRIL